MTHAPAGLFAWMERYVDGDEVAFAHLHRLLAPRLRGFLTKIVANGDIDDLVQVTLLKAHLARERFEVRGDPDGAVLGWYFAIAKNVAMDHLRARHRAQRRSSDREQGHALEEIIDDAPDPQTVGEDRERHDEIIARVRDAIAALAPRQREVIELHKLRGMSMAQIADRLDMREGAVRVRAHRAYRALARLLGGRDP